MQRLPLPGPSSLGQNPIAKSPPSSDFALRDILERWAGSDDTLKVVMMAKAEEDRLKQEVMRLEIRRTEMEMLREAVRAGIQPHLIPQLFSSGGYSTQSLYTPGSPSHAQTGPSARMPYPPPQQIPAYGKSGQPSPRFLPKLETNNLQAGSGQSQAAPPPASAPASDHRQSSNAGSNGEAVPRTALPAGQDAESSSLFFHHWQPPQSSHGGLMNPGETNSRSSGVEPPGSPTPRKKKLQQYHILNSVASPSPSRKSPTRGHVRHRSEASGLGSRFNDHYMNPVTSSSSFSRMSHDRDSPNPLPPPSSQNPTSHEIDLARKRKRTEQETLASDASAASTIPEESTAEVRS